MAELPTALSTSASHWLPLNVCSTLTRVRKFNSTSFVVIVITGLHNSVRGLHISSLDWYWPNLMHLKALLQGFIMPHKICFVSLYMQPQNHHYQGYSLRLLINLSDALIQIWSSWVLCTKKILTDLLGCKLLVIFSLGYMMTDICIALLTGILLIKLYDSLPLYSLLSQILLSSSSE